MSNHKLFQIFIKFDKKNPTVCKKYDKKLITFIKQNIDNLNNHGNILDLILVDKNNKSSISKLKHKRGASRFPVLFMNNNKIEGTIKITNFLTRVCRGKVTASLLNNEEMIHAYQMRQIGDNSLGLMNSYDDDDEYDRGDNTIMARATEETQRRQERFNARGAYGRQINKKRNYNMRHRGKQFRNNDDYGSDEESEYESEIDERPQGRGRRRGRGRNIDIRDSTADIEKTITSRNQQETDLMAGFWENKEETTISG